MRENVNGGDPVGNVGSDRRRVNLKNRIVFAGPQHRLIDDGRGNVLGQLRFDVRLGWAQPAALA